MASQPATTPAAASDLISFLKALPDCRMRRGIRFPQWWKLLVAIVAILSGQGSLVRMERFAKRPWQTLNDLLGTDFGKSPSDSTFRLLLAQLDVPGFESLLRDWMAAQPGVADELETLVRDGKALRGSIAENDSGAVRFIAQVSLYSQSLGVAIAQSAYATMPVARSKPFGSCWRRWSFMACWCRPMRCTRTALFVYLAQRNADFLIAVKHCRPKGFRLIKDRLTYSRRIPWRTSKREIKRGRDITQELRAMPAPDWVVEQQPGSATIIAVRSHGIREGMPQDETRYQVTSLRTGGKALLTAIRQRWSIENSWHWVRDVPLREDAHRYREDNGVQILAALRSLAINALRLDGIWSITEGIAALAHDIKGLLKLLGWRPAAGMQSG